MIGNSLNNLNGYLMLDSIRFINAGEELVMDQLLFESEVSGKSSKIHHHLGPDQRKF